MFVESSGNDENEENEKDLRESFVEKKKVTASTKCASFSVIPDLNEQIKASFSPNGQFLEVEEIGNPEILSNEFLIKSIFGLNHGIWAARVLLYRRTSKRCPLIK